MELEHGFSICPLSPLITPDKGLRLNPGSVSAEGKLASAVVVTVSQPSARPFVSSHAFPPILFSTLKTNPGGRGLPCVSILRDEGYQDAV